MRFTSILIIIRLFIFSDRNTLIYLVSMPFCMYICYLFTLSIKLGGAFDILLSVHFSYHNFKAWINKTIANSK